MQIIRIIQAVCLLLLSFNTYAETQKSALIIGNNNYNQEPLKNPRNDAQLIASTLRKAGFDTVVHNDLKRSNFFSVVRSFTENLKPGSIGLVYYAGHGMQIDKSNYLLPVDIRISNETGIKINAYPLDKMLERLDQSQAAVSIVILDSCRNNPFLKSSRTRGFNNLGLHKVVAPKGMLIAYSTKPGSVAQDGNGKNSIYSLALAETLKQQGLTIEETFNQVAYQVRQMTNDQQQPLIETSIVDTFYFNPPDGVAVVPSTNKTRIKNIDASIQHRKINRFEETNTLIKTEVDDTIADTSIDWNELEIQQTLEAQNATEEDIKSIMISAKQGDRYAQTTLGLIYEFGIKRLKNARSRKVYAYEPDLKKSFEWISKASDQGYPLAQVLLGEKYALGHGVKVDKDKSKMLFTLASRVNLKRAKLNLYGVKGLF